ncbi:FMR1-interacting protein NUFIP2 [Engraulis encrasicolus]|uniref:FMR1-interacting protein NUFIP2 n=1 Tax=Engraulis encrasicolus TaxID=184585 RepID=UPI002FD0F4FD
MEERPNEGALGRYSNHGKAESNTDRLNKLVNNDQCHCQHQDEETSTKKTGYGKVNGNTGEGEEISTALNPNSITHPTRDSGHEDNRRPLEHPLKPRTPSSKTQAAYPGAAERSKAAESGSSSSSNSVDPLISNMDCPNDRPPDLKTLEGKKEALVSLNGLVVTPSSSCGSSPLTNGYPGKPGGSLTDNDGSGSENGYTTPKKRRSVQRGAAKAAAAGGDVVIVQSTAAAKAMHPTATAGKQQRPDSPFSTESADKSPAFVPHGNGRTPRELPAASAATPSASPALPPAEFPQKNSEGKVATGAGAALGAAAGKKPDERPVKAKAVTAAASAAAKDDSWTLFKPPPVFPVDNSSAKIVPKISYASKVKENLNRVNAAVAAAQASSSLSPAAVSATAAAERDLLLPPTQTPPPPMPPGKLSQVPMSAVKTITSASFTNGPLPPAEGSSSSNNGCPLPGAPFNTSPPSTAPAPLAAAAAGGMASGALVSPVQGGENVASPSSSSSATSPCAGGGGGVVAPPVVPEPRKPSLFVYPHAAGPPSNMQLSLPSGRQADPPGPPSSSSTSSSSVASGGPASSSSSSSNPGQPAHQKSLGDIFQNQWGLSFINEPSAGPVGGGGGGGGGSSVGAGAAASRTEGRGKPTVVTFQGGFPPSSAPLPPPQGSTTSAQRQEHHHHTHAPHHHHHPPFPKSHELDKRTSPLSSGRVGPLRSSPGPLAAAAAPQEGGGLLHTTPSLPSGAPKEPEPRNLSAIVFSSSSSSAKDQGGDLPQASPTNTAPVLALAREQGYTKGFERSSWGMFDLKAAVIYHTKEMEYILNIQKQDPKRVVLYRDTKDGPNQ